jgi:ribosome-binding ATPase
VRIGIVGLPNAGKSTLFNALTRAGAETAIYPFTTVDPNIAVVEVPDERLEPVAAAAGASPSVPETIEFVDIAGLVRGSSEGEGLGNRFLAQIRETDAICHVVRTHGEEAVPHPEGRVDPAADIGTVEDELRRSDLEQAERRLQRVAREAKAGGAEAVAERDWLEAVRDALAAGGRAAEVAVPADARAAAATLSPLTAKPVLFVANVDEGAPEPPAPVSDAAARAGAAAIAISARIEAELGELEPGEAEDMRADLGLGEPGLPRLIRAAYELLDLITFFTAHQGSEAMARGVRRGSTAYEAAGQVHSEIQAGFVRAEVIGWRQLVEAGSYAAARERGTLRTEGRDYVVEDGDVVTIKHRE